MPLGCPFIEKTAFDLQCFISNRYKGEILAKDKPRIGKICNWHFSGGLYSIPDKGKIVL